MVKEFYGQVTKDARLGGNTNRNWSSSMCWLPTRLFLIPTAKSQPSHTLEQPKKVARVAGSAAAHAEEILSLYGVKKVTARILTCQPRGVYKHG